MYYSQNPWVDKPLALILLHCLEEIRHRICRAGLKQPKHKKKCYQSLHRRTIFTVFLPLLVTIAYPTNRDGRRKRSKTCPPKQRHCTDIIWWQFRYIKVQKVSSKEYPFWTLRGTLKKRVTLHSLAINMCAEISAMLYCFTYWLDMEE